MTLQQLRAFLAIVEHGSFRRAARALAISQAGLTGAVQSLEATLGVQLLHRSAQGVRLTEAGARLLPRARLIHSESGRAIDEATQAQAQHAPLLRVGLGPTPTAALLRQVVPDFHARHPTVRLKLVEGFFAQLQPALQQGQIELAITAVPTEGVGPGLKSRKLFRSDLTVVARRAHPLAGARALRQLAGQEWVLLGSPGGPGGTVLRFHEEQALAPPRIAATCESFTQLAALIGGSDWLAIVPSALVHNGFMGSEVAAIRLAEPTPRYDNCVVHRADTPMTPAAAAFAAMFASCARVLMQQAGEAPAAGTSTRRVAGRTMAR